MRHYILSYDISDNALRVLVAKSLLKHACQRLQKSVFLAPNVTATELQKLKQELENILSQHPKAEKTDSLVCFSIQKQEISEMVIWGKTEGLRKILEEVLFLLI